MSISPACCTAGWSRRRCRNARIKSIDISAAENIRAVKAIHVLDRDRSAAQTEEEKADKYPRVRTSASPSRPSLRLTREDAEDAARLIKIEYEPMPWVIDTTKAMQPTRRSFSRARRRQAGRRAAAGGARDAGSSTETSAGPTGQGKEQTLPRLDSAFAEAEASSQTELSARRCRHTAPGDARSRRDYKPDQITLLGVDGRGTSSVRDEFVGRLRE
jgi:xanthine dehydrogenase YagR molybdenum-binding subunit